MKIVYSAWTVIRKIWKNYLNFSKNITLKIISLKVLSKLIFCENAHIIKKKKID